MSNDIVNVLQQNIDTHFGKEKAIVIEEIRRRMAEGQPLPDGVVSIEHNGESWTAHITLGVLMAASPEFDTPGLAAAIHQLMGMRDFQPITVTGLQLRNEIGYIKAAANDLEGLPCTVPEVMKWLSSAEAKYELGRHGITVTCQEFNVAYGDGYVKEAKALFRINSDKFNGIRHVNPEFTPFYAQLIGMGPEEKVRLVRYDSKRPERLWEGYRRSWPERDHETGKNVIQALEYFDGDLQLAAEAIEVEFDELKYYIDNCEVCQEALEIIRRFGEDVTPLNMMGDDRWMVKLHGSMLLLLDSGRWGRPRKTTKSREQRQAMIARAKARAAG